MKMEILLESTSNKLMVEHAEYDESNTYVLERFNTSAGNPVKKILLKLNLSDHRLCKMVVECQSVKVKEFQERCNIKAFQEWYEHVGPEVASPQGGKVARWRRDCAWLMISKGSRSLCQIQVQGTSSIQEVNDHYNIFTRESQEYELKTKDKAYGYSNIAEGDLRKFSDIGACKSNAQIVRDDMVRVQVPRCMAWLNYDEHVDSLSMMDNEVGVTRPESTTQTLPSFEEYTPPVTYLEEVEKTLGTPIEVEHLNKTKLEEVSLNCNHNTPLSSREVPSFNGPKPQPLLNSPSLDEMFDGDWRLESKEVSPLSEELSLFNRPNEVERGRILEAHRLEPILQQQNSQRMDPSHHGGTNIAKSQENGQNRTNTNTGTDRVYKSRNYGVIGEVMLKGCANSEDSIKEVVNEAMTKLTLREYMEEVQEDYGLNTTTLRFNENSKFELGDEFLKILRDNAFNGTNGDNVVDHTAKVFAILELIKIPNVDPNQLRIHVFPLSLTGAARKWWIDEIDGKITTWEGLMEKFFHKYYPYPILVKYVD
ncbi:hypothetical protein Tco_1430574 [Tanacetum coccineum]